MVKNPFMHKLAINAESGVEWLPKESRNNELKSFSLDFIFAGEELN